ncbi:unnamed protein product [Protopolystoma xenopodis]|uniref:Uncharacterized protein n=1 Tax=Protopolystoma xenopodis TaxID=117903 RepID=A0A448XEQ6_9PLAT|nr:unnamed protein product [Protopolystoma xenopodis]
MSLYQLANLKTAAPQPPCNQVYSDSQWLPSVNFYQVLANNCAESPGPESNQQNSTVQAMTCPEPSWPDRPAAGFGVPGKRSCLKIAVLGTNESTEMSAATSPLTSTTAGVGERGKNNLSLVRSPAIPESLSTSDKKTACRVGSFSPLGAGGEYQTLQAVCGESQAVDDLFCGYNTLLPNNRPGLQTNRQQNTYRRQMPAKEAKPATSMASRQPTYPPGSEQKSSPVKLANALGGFSFV